MDPHAPDLTPNRRASDLVQQATQADWLAKVAEIKARYPSIS